MACSVRVMQPRFQARIGADKRNDFLTVAPPW
jgi:hypothetical protein